MYWASQVAPAIKILPANAGDLGSILGWEDPLEEGMAAHSSTFAWRIPWTEEPGGLSLWGCRELDTNERQTLTHIHNYLLCSNKCLINIFLIIFKVKFNSKAIICKSVYSFLSFCVASTWRHLFYYQFLPVSVVNMEDINLNKNRNQKSRKIPMNNYNKAYVKVWRIRKSS